MDIDKTYKILADRAEERKLERKERDKIWECARECLKETAKVYKTNQNRVRSLWNIGGTHNGNN